MGIFKCCLAWAILAVIDTKSPWKIFINFILSGWDAVTRSSALCQCLWCSHSNRKRSHSCTANRRGSAFISYLKLLLNIKQSQFNVFSWIKPMWLEFRWASINFSLLHHFSSMLYQFQQLEEKKIVFWERFSVSIINFF